MDKKQYEAPEMQVILTTGEDIITTSIPGGSEIDSGFGNGDD